MATYNCTDNTNSAYGVGDYGTCTGQTIGAPNTGVFEQVLNSGSFTILLPIAAAIFLVALASIFARRTSRQKNPNN